MLWLFNVMPFPSLQIFPLSVIFQTVITYRNLKGGNCTLSPTENLIQIPNHPCPLKYQSCRYLSTQRNTNL